MRKLYIFSVIGLAVVIIGLAFADQMTLSTYYPAPYGVYKEMNVHYLDFKNNEYYVGADPSNPDNMPDAEAGRMCYDYDDGKVKYFDGVAHKWAPFAVGEMRSYVSDWARCAVGGTYQKNHGLGSNVLHTQVQFAPDIGGAPNLSRVTNIDLSQWRGNYRGVQVKNITSTHLTVQFANEYILILRDDGKGAGFTYGHYRVIATRVD